MPEGGNTLNNSSMGYYVNPQKYVIPIKPSDMNKVLVIAHKHSYHVNGDTQLMRKLWGSSLVVLTYPLEFIPLHTYQQYQC